MLLLQYGSMAAWIVPEGIHPTNLEVKEQKEHKYAAIHIERPFDNPFVPNRYFFRSGHVPFHNAACYFFAGISGGL